MSPQCHAFVQEVIALYRRWAGHHVRPRRADRVLAAQLHERAIPLAIVEAAIRLAVARRNARPPDAPPLNPIRSLHYFLPILGEILARPLSDSYLAYLNTRTPGPPPHDRPAKKVQIPALFDDR